jgi:rod shape determining protein RodA
MSLGSFDTGARPDLVLRPFRLHHLVIDVPLLLTLLAISGVGFVVLYSAVGGDTPQMLRQGVRLLMALTAFALVAQIPPRLLSFSAWRCWSS